MNTAKIMYEWENSFNKTRAKSTINEEKAQDIDMKYYQGYITSKDKDYKNLNRLRNALCPHKYRDCSCNAMSGVV